MSDLVINDSHTDLIQRTYDNLQVTDTSDYADALKYMECFLCFNSAYNENGVYVNLSDFSTLCKSHLFTVPASTEPILLLHLKCSYSDIPEVSSLLSETDAISLPKKLAMGITGGFDGDPKKSQTTTLRLRLSIFQLGSLEVTLCEHIISEFDKLLKGSETMISEAFSLLEPLKLPVVISDRIRSYFNVIVTTLNTDTMVPWEDSPLKESKFSKDLFQIDNPPHIQLTGNQCAICGATENIWLNLSDGYIGCGRLNYGVGGGCSGNREGAAVLHYNEHPDRPLAVKLGTITTNGNSDVYSYMEDDMVIDPLLTEHLLHFGIDAFLAEKTEKTLTEMQIEHNMLYNWSKITEKGENLKQLTGPGYMGLENLGNTCYMNSVIQLLLNVDVIKNQYGEATSYSTMIHRAISTGKGVPGAVNDLAVQFAKLAIVNSPCSTKYTSTLEGQSSQEASVDSNAVAPTMLRRLVTVNHREFATERQQDAAEFMMYFINMFRRYDILTEMGGGGMSTSIKDLFSARYRTTLRCSQTNMVKYFQEDNVTWSIYIPTNHNDNDDIQIQAKRHKTDKQQEDTTNSPCEDSNIELTSSCIDTKVISFKDCVDAWAADSILQDFRSPVTGQRSNATQNVRFECFPKYLIIQLKRFYLSSDGSTRKIQNPIAVPLVLDLEYLRAPIVNPNDVEMSDSPSHVASTYSFDESLLQSLSAIGFSENAAKRAILACRQTASVEVLVDWLVSNTDNPQLNDPLEDVDKTTCTSVKQITENDIDMNSHEAVILSSMGFSVKHIKAALAATDKDITRATDWLFSHMDDLDTATDVTLHPEAVEKTDIHQNDSGAYGMYDLQGFVSHAGSSVHCGHYVCHNFIGGRWVLYNDCKVAESHKPPIEFGYLYAYKRRSYRAV